MTRIQFLLLTLGSLALCIAGCGDDSSGGVNTTPTDASTVDSGGSSGSNDGAVDPVDAGSQSNMDMGPVVSMDAEAPPADVSVDAMIVADAAPMEPDADPIIMPMGDCMSDDTCGDHQRCIGGVCSLDVRPETFVIDNVEVSQPEQSAGLLQGALMGVINSNQLNLVVEPGGYTDEGDYRWYIGNGGFRDGTYIYLGRYPIQNFDGFWRQSAEGAPYWGMEGDTPFVLNVPMGQVQTAEGETVTCMTAFNTTVDLRITPRLNEAGAPYLYIQMTGFLRESDARTVRFQFNNVEVQLIDLLDPSDLNVDTDDDGVPDAYPFDFSGTAAAITFAGDPPAADGSNRDPDPGLSNPPECDE